MVKKRYHRHPAKNVRLKIEPKNFDYIRISVISTTILHSSLTRKF